MTPETAAYAERQFLLYAPGHRESGAENITIDGSPGTTGSDVLPLQALHQKLAGTAAARITSASELMRDLERTRRSEKLPTTLIPFDTLLGGGLPRGKMVELIGRRGAGRFSIALSAIAASTSMGEAAALVDLGDHLDPQLAEEDGIDLRRVLWVRPRTMRQAVMSAEMILGAGFQLVVVDAGLHPIRGRVPDASWVRLGRSAEAHGAALLVSTPYALTGTASEAVIRTTCTRMTWSGHGRSPRLLTGVDVGLVLEKHRHRRAGERAMLELRTAVGSAGDGARGETGRGETGRGETGRGETGRASSTSSPRSPLAPSPLAPSPLAPSPLAPFSPRPVSPSPDPRLPTPIAL